MEINLSNELHRLLRWLLAGCGRDDIPSWKMLLKISDVYLRLYRRHFFPKKPFLGGSIYDKEVLSNSRMESLRGTMSYPNNMIITFFC